MKDRKIIFHDVAMLSKSMEENFHFQHALNHCMQIYNSNSICSFIPKNLSTSMRTSIAIENKYISFNKEGMNWNNYNTTFFKPTFKDLFNASFTFVILRNPFGRLYSFFCDFVSREAQNIHSSLLLSIIKEILNKSISDLTFEEFIKLLDGDLIHSNSHWSPQKYFLIYENYDLYVPFEKFNEYTNKIEKHANIKIYDTRELKPFRLNKHEKISDTYYGNFKGSEIKELKKLGKIPNIKSMFNDELINIVKRLFQDDISLYKKKFTVDPLDIFN
jgi:hypothetical protein